MSAGQPAGKAFSFDGQLLALRTWPSSVSGDIVRDVISAADGNLYVTGEIHGSVLNVDPWPGRAFLGRIPGNSGDPGSDSRPSVQVSRSGTELHLTWPADAGAFVPEATGSLNEAFAPVTIEAVEGAENTFRLPIGAENQFIRLKN